jgi:hypothetical protein
MRRKNQRAVWVSPWGYAEGWLFAAGLLITGLALQLATGGLNPDSLSWPVNLYVGLGFSGLIAGSWLLFRKNNLVNWLARVPAAITSIALVTFLVLVMGFTLQEDAQNPVWVQRLGLSNMTSSWPFLLGMAFFMTSLGMTTMKRVTPFRGRNIGFFLNHAGLYILILTGLLGSADLQRYTMQLHEGEIVWLASDENGNQIEMPVALELQQFNMEEYNPKVAVIEPHSGRIVAETVSEMFELEAGNRSRIFGYEVEVLRFYEMSGPVEDRYEPANSFGAAPSALVKITSEDGMEKEGWISSGSFMVPHSLIDLEHEYGYALAMTIPQASHYSSDVTIYTESGDVREAKIEVNHPIKAEGWNLYQYSYDERFGRWSPSSVIEAVRDPWLPAVYTGIFMVMIGSVYLMTLGKSPKTSNDGES